jgi:type I restriction enzyme, S subunit
MSGHPEDWRLEPFGKIVTQSQYGLSVPTSLGGKYPMFKMNNFKSGRMSAANVDTVDLGSADLEKFSLQHGDILFNRTNSIDLVGKTGLFDLEGTYTFASYLIRFKINRRIADPFFVNYFFNWSQSQIRLKEIATLGVSQANINPTTLQKFFKILIPPLPEQRKIAEILSTWDKAIELLEQLIAMKRKLKQGLMQQLLAGKRRFKEFEGSEWKFTKIEDIAEINPRKHPKDLQFLGEFVEMASVSESGQLERIAYVELPGATTGYTPFMNDDTLIAKITPCFENGKGAFVKGLQGLGLGSTEFHVLRSRQEVLPKYLYYLTRTYGFKLRGTASMQGSGGQQRVPTDFVRRYKVKIPSFHEQQKIVDVLYSADAEISTLEKQLSAYKQQKRGLMQQLLTGKKRVASPPSTVFDSGRPLSNYVERGENLA